MTYKTLEVSENVYNKFQKLRLDLQFKEKKKRKESDLVDLLIRMFRNGWDKS